MPHCFTCCWCPQIIAAVSVFVLALLGFSALGSSVSAATMQFIGWECFCAMIMGGLSMLSTRLAFAGRYGHAVLTLVGGHAMEGGMLYLVSRTQVLTSAQATKVIVGLHLLCAGLLALFGSLWQKACNKVCACVPGCVSSCWGRFPTVCECFNISDCLFYVLLLCTCTCLWVLLVFWLVAPPFSSTQTLSLMCFTMCR